MAVQEALERLEHSEIYTDDNEHSSSPQSQLIILIDIFTLGRSPCASAKVVKLYMSPQQYHA